MIETTQHDGVTELRLARPPANALSPELLTALFDAVHASTVSGARALVLSGAPGMFSAGLDVPEFLKLDRPAVREAWRILFRAMHALAASPIPVVAALTGHAPAGGCVLALCCDARVLAEGRFKIGLNEVQVGVRAPLPILAVARHVVGTRQAERMLTTAELFGGEEALRIGLVDEIVPADEVVARSIERARAWTQLPQKTLAKTRQLARAEPIAALENVDAAEEERFLDEWFDDECQGALQALVDRLAAKKT